MYKGLAWRPADAGYATAYAAYKLVKGEAVETGADLLRLRAMTRSQLRTILLSVLLL